MIKEVEERNGDQNVSLKSDSPFKEVQDLYGSGFTYEQILSITNFFIAIDNRHFTKLDGMEEVNEN